MWEVRGSANCHLDPWMTGVAAAGCNGMIASSTPNAPVKIFKSMVVPVTAGVLDQQARAFLTGKTLKAMAAENQAPVIVKPAEGSLAPVPVELTIQAGPGSPTKNFALEWQSFENGAWVPKTIQDQAGLDSKIPIASFGNASQVRVRARAHQSANAKWSDWRSFKVPYLPPPPPPVTPTPCPNTAAYGATYDVSGMPASIKAGTTGSATIKVTNSSNQIWPAGSNFHVSYHWAQNGVVVVYDGERTFLPTTVLPCFSIVVSATVKAPPAAGAYQIQWDMVLEGVSWFSAKGVPTGNKNVTVTP